jgi:hypothetical protein
MPTATFESHGSDSKPPQKTLTQRLKRAGVMTFRALSGLVVVFLGWDTLIKLFAFSVAVEGTASLGYPVHLVIWIGLLEFLCLVIYLLPRTEVLGAVLWTAYLGGAIATHVRVGNPLFSHVLFPIYIAVFLWGKLWLKSETLRQVLPLEMR